MRLGQILYDSECRITKAEKELKELVIPSVKTLNHLLSELKVRDSEKKPIITDLGAQESVYRRLGSITDQSPNTLVLDANKENLKIDIAGNDFTFSKNKGQTKEGKVYVYNTKQLHVEHKKQRNELELKRKLLISILKFRDAMQMMQGKVNLQSLLKAKSLNFTCREYLDGEIVLIIRLSEGNCQQV